MGIRLVEICPLVWWVHIWDFWFQPPVICRVGERMISTCVVPTVKHGGGGVMVWRCFAGDTDTDLFRIQSTLNQHGYHRNLQRYAMPSGLRLVGLSFVFQQANDPKHTSRLCRGYLTKKESDAVLHQMTRPSQSPELNPIEMVWTAEWRKSIYQVLSICGLSFKTVGKAFLMKLVERMQRVCKAVIKAKGGYVQEFKIYV